MKPNFFSKAKTLMTLAPMPSDQILARKTPATCFANTPPAILDDLYLVTLNFGLDANLSKNIQNNFIIIVQPCLFMLY